MGGLAGVEAVHWTERLDGVVGEVDNSARLPGVSLTVSW